MKKRFIILLLTGMLLLSLAACGGASVQSVLPAENVTVPDADNVTDEEDYTPVIPEAVLSEAIQIILEVCNILLNGELKDGVYINRYFGLKFTAPEGFSLSRLNDDATESTEIIPLRKTYEDGLRGIMITTDLGLPETVFINVYAADEDQIGFSEEELVRAKIQETNELVTSFGLEEGSEYSTAVLAGEEHPIQLSTSDPECIDVYFHIIKDGFIFQISVSAPDEEGIAYLLSFFEKS